MSCTIKKINLLVQLADIFKKIVAQFVDNSKFVSFEIAIDHNEIMQLPDTSLTGIRQHYRAQLIKRLVTHLLTDHPEYLKFEESTNEHDELVCSLTLNLLGVDVKSKLIQLQEEYTEIKTELERLDSAWQDKFTVR